MTSSQQILLSRFTALNWTIPNWVEYGKCEFGVEENPQKGPKFDLLVISSTKSIFVDRKHDSKSGVGDRWQNLSGVEYNWKYRKSGTVQGPVKLESGSKVRGMIVE